MLATAGRLAPALVVITAVDWLRFEESADALRELSARAPVRIAGAGADAQIAAELGAGYIDGDPVVAAFTLAP